MWDKFFNRDFQSTINLWQSMLEKQIFIKFFPMAFVENFGAKCDYEVPAGNFSAGVIVKCSNSACRTTEIFIVARISLLVSSL